MRYKLINPKYENHQFKTKKGAGSVSSEFVCGQETIHLNEDKKTPRSHQKFIERTFHEILCDPSSLGPNRQAVIKYNSDEQTTYVSQNSLSSLTSEKFLLCRHQTMLFEGKNCSMITVRDLTQYYVCKFANDQIGYL
jgi:hypothetical protein